MVKIAIFLSSILSARRTMRFKKRLFVVHTHLLNIGGEYIKNHNSDGEQKLLLTKYQKNHNSDGEQKLLLTKYR